MNVSAQTAKRTNYDRSSEEAVAGTSEDGGTGVEAVNCAQTNAEIDLQLSMRMIPCSV